MAYFCLIVVTFDIIPDCSLSRTFVVFQHRVVYCSTTLSLSVCDYRRGQGEVRATRSQDSGIEPNILATPPFCFCLNGRPVRVSILSKGKGHTLSYLVAHISS